MDGRSSLPASAERELWADFLAICDCGGRLAGTESEARAFALIEQRAHVVGREASTEVARGGRIGNPACAEGIEKDCIIAAQFEILQTGAITQRVVSDVEDVIGFMVGQVDEKDMQAAIDGVDEAELSGQAMDRADAAVVDTVDAPGNLIMNIRGGEHRSATAM